MREEALSENQFAERERNIFYDTDGNLRVSI